VRLPQDLDFAALALITHDVILVDDGDLMNPTPCGQWTVADLVRHMNDEHEDIAELVLGPMKRRSNDPRDDFPLIAARWVMALDQAGPNVMVPKMQATIQRDLVHSVHHVDMLVHRWDLSKALQRSCLVANELTDPAIPIARAMTAPGSPLVGQVYAKPRDEPLARTPVDILAALLGRDPNWAAPTHD
jgi:uncharacterized protein (TIGR03086 family)